MAAADRLGVVRAIRDLVGVGLALVRDSACRCRTVGALWNEEQGDVVVAWEPSLVSEFKRLESGPSPHQRGLQLEKLLERLFQKAHFLVQRNADAARPRHTDLVAGYDNTWYIIEAKWEQHPVGTNVVDDVRIRVEGAGQGSIGVIIGVTGCNDAAVERVLQYRDRQVVLLIGEKELLQALQSPELLANLLKKKRDQLVAHGRVHLGSDTTRKTRRRSTDDLPESSLSLLSGDQAPLPYLAAEDGFSGGLKRLRRPSRCGWMHPPFVVLPSSAVRPAVGPTRVSRYQRRR
nr:MULTISPECIES: restriction endonuclease [unclassified Streptomyces]